MLATEGQLGEFLIGTSNRSEILRENVGIQFLSLRHYPMNNRSLQADSMRKFQRNSGVMGADLWTARVLAKPKFVLSPPIFSEPLD
jgi:hypothetical protein